MADSNQFQAGDVVNLPSGGPRMTVQGPAKVEGWIECVWFNAAGDVKRDAFAAVTLASGNAQDRIS